MGNDVYSGNSDNILAVKSDLLSKTNNFEMLVGQITDTINRLGDTWSDETYQEFYTKFNTEHVTKLNDGITTMKNFVGVLELSVKENDGIKHDTLARFR